MLRRLVATALLLAGLSLASGTIPGADDKKDEGGWVQLFNGKDLSGWKTFDPKQLDKAWFVKDGILYSRGKEVSHLFSERDDYQDFHYRIEAKISDKGNSGQYFRAKFAPGYPPGYEAQINSTFPTDPVRTGSIYHIKKNFVPPAKDDEWFTEEIVVRGKTIKTYVNDKLIAEYTEPEGKTGTMEVIGKGTFALQAHDPRSKTFYKNLRVKRLD